MRSNFLIRTAIPDDTGQLLDIYAHLSSDNERCSLDAARLAIDKINMIDGSAIFIGEIAGSVVTTCTLIVVPNLTRGGRPYAIIENVVTHPDHRGQGLGTAILDAACDQAWSHRCYKVMLSTGSKRTSTLSFYQNAGFEQTRTGFQKRRLPRREDN